MPALPSLTSSLSVHQRGRGPKRREESALWCALALAGKREEREKSVGIQLEGEGEREEREDYVHRLKKG